MTLFCSSQPFFLLTDLPGNPPGWNQSSDSFCFRYRHSASSPSEVFLLKMLRMENQLFIVWSRRSDNVMRTCEVNVDDYLAADVALDQFDRLYRDLPSC